MKEDTVKNKLKILQNFSLKSDLFMLFKDKNKNSFIFIHKGGILNTDLQHNEFIQKKKNLNCSFNNLKHENIIICADFPTLKEVKYIHQNGFDLILTDFDPKLHNDYMNFISKVSIDNYNCFNEDVKVYARVRNYCYEKNIIIYHPSREIAKKGSFLEYSGRIKKIDRKDLNVIIDSIDIAIEYEIFSLTI